MKREWKKAHEMLSKRQNLLPKYVEILELLSTKLIGEEGRPTAAEI
jgi:hypothetical protein